MEVSVLECVALACQTTLCVVWALLVIIAAILLTMPLVPSAVEHAGLQALFVRLAQLAIFAAMAHFCRFVLRFHHVALNKIN